MSLPKRGQTAVRPDADNGGIKLAKGFGALAVTEGVGKARHMVVAPNGDILVKLSRLESNGGIALLQDTNGDGKTDKTSYFGNYVGTGIEVGGGYLYASSDSSVYRYKLNANGSVNPDAKPETIVTGLEFYREHGSKSLALDGKGNLYVNFGAPSNACQERNRVKGSKGMDPCPILEWHGGIWRFSASKPNQTQKDGVRYATGIRNVVGMDWNAQVGQLFAMQHGRDNLNNWGGMFTDSVSAELPAEEFLLVRQGSDFGWPYCYYDQSQKKKMLAPEYGGDGKVVGDGKMPTRCTDKDQPIMAFPGHWAPNDLLFYTGKQFPERYRNGAFICFHGSWNRAPMKQAGYFVAFVPFKNGKPVGDYEVFAEGFAGGPETTNPADAKHRPMGLAQGADGSLYISDSVKGKVWRVMYTTQPAR
ncbi:MAG: PQQ-dependent sugar dehydrogenase [Cytophagales bacterium]|nr:PQQ-dependent sugar dehydrogenase [Cytophagales bacterium]